MNKFYLILLLLSSFSFSQKIFSPGYYIDNNGQKKVGFIEDNNPYNNPEKIAFKTSLESKSSIILLDEIREYKIDNDYKYVRYLIDYDQDQVTNANPVHRIGKEPKLANKQVLLRVLVEGNASLYQAIINDCIFFFVQHGKVDMPQLLVHRKYNSNNVIAENNEFRKLLYERLKTDKTDIKDFFDIEYNQYDLVDFFRKLNKADNSLIQQNVTTERNKNKINYKILTGTTALSVDYKFGSLVNMKSTGTTFINPIIGCEVSNLLGMSSKRSEFFGRLFFQKNQTKADQTFITPGYVRTYTFEAEYSAINLNLGYRYALLKQKHSKICLDGSIGISNIVTDNFVIKDVITYTGENPPDPTGAQYDFYRLRPVIYFNVGLGYVLDEKYALYIEYSTPKNYLEKYVELDGQLSGINVLLTYNLN